LLCLADGATAQPARIYRIGLLETSSASANQANVDALLRGLRETGYAEGKNIVIDYRSADGRAERFPELAADLLRAKPDVIVARGSLAIAAAMKAGTVPVVMTSSADPVGARLVANLANPGGNVTGLSSFVAELHAKQLQLLKQLLPNLTRFGVIFNMANPAVPGQRKRIEQAATRLGMQASFFDARDREGLRRALDAAVADGVTAVIDATPEVSTANRRFTIELAATHKLPVLTERRDYTEAGGLISYGVHYPDLYYRAAFYIDKILKGARPGDMPIEQPTKFELVINLKTARSLGIDVPREVLLLADEVIR
jgi:putative ABC transport system substrate-binding protein